MLQRPLRDIRGGQSANSRALPPPVGGINARDPYDLMPITDAIELKNWFPRSDGLVTRPGYASHCNTGTGARIGTIEEYEYGTSHRMLAASNGGVYDVTGTTPTTVKTGLSTTAVNFVTATLNGTMFWANGTNTLQAYSAGSMADATFTGLTLADINYVHVHGSRVFAIKKNTQSFFYGGTEAVSGALTEFNLGLTDTFRGNLFAIASMSRDGGAGPDDYIVFFFEGGSAAVYQGTNPGDAANWSHVGTYELGRPLSRHAVFEYEADIYILTTRGLESFAAVLPKSDLEQSGQQYLSDKIQPKLLNFVNRFGAVDTFQISVYDNGEMLILTCPLTSGLSQQFVRNTLTGAWCRFDVAATKWCQFGNYMYFGDDSGVVYWFDGDSWTDNGVQITCDATQAFTYFQDRGHVKKLNLIQPTFITSALPPVRLSIGVDFQLPDLDEPLTVAKYDPSYVWDDATSTWDVATWTLGAIAHNPWLKFNALGRSFSTRMILQVTQKQVEWSATNYIYERGGLI